MNTWRTLDNGQIEVNGETPVTTGATLARVQNIIARFGDVIAAAEDRHGVPRGWGFGFAEAEAPRNLDPGFVSFDHGVGIFQLTSQAARDGHSDEELFDPATNADAAMKFVARLRTFPWGADLPSVAAAYNAGSPRSDSSNEWGLHTFNHDYISRVVAANNTAVELLGTGGGSSKSVFGKLAKGALAGGVILALVNLLRVAFGR